MSASNQQGGCRPPDDAAPRRSPVARQRAPRATACALCGDPVDLEHPGMDGGLVEVNPETMREATMHGWCLSQAIEGLSAAELERYTERMQAGR